MPKSKDISSDDAAVQSSGEFVAADEVTGAALILKDRFPTEDEFAEFILGLEADVAALKLKIFGRSSQ